MDARSVLQSTLSKGTLDAARPLTVVTVGSSIVAFEYPVVSRIRVQEELFRRTVGHVGTL